MTQHNTTQDHIYKSNVYQSYRHDGLPMGGSVKLACVVLGEETNSDTPLPPLWKDDTGGRHLLISGSAEFCSMF